MIPFFTYYSMFGFQRIGDLIWAFADSRGKGFLMGGTAGRTTLSGEGLQHQDGHSLVLASTVPTCRSYDPAYAYEIAVIIQDGIRRMYQEMEDRFYYLTIYNENYAQPAMPEGVADGILRGMYRYKTAENGNAQVQLFGSGPILNEALRAQKILAEKLPGCRPTSGASPATTNCAATLWKWSAGTGCIPPSRNASPTCCKRSKASKGPSSRPPIT
jgi:pyruvate dehydrogenase E1 component